MANGWTPERRAKQAELIRQWMPWAKSTGPRSAEGRERVSRNASTGGHRAQLRELSKMVNAAVRQARELIDCCVYAWSATKVNKSQQKSTKVNKKSAPNRPDFGTSASDATDSKLIEASVSSLLTSQANQATQDLTNVVMADQA